MQHNFLKIFTIIALLILTSCSSDLDTSSMSLEKKNKISDLELFELRNSWCEKDNLTACYNLGYMYNDGKGVKQDHKKAKQLFERVCDANIREGCTSLGLLYQTAKGTKKNYHKAKTLYVKACSMDDPMGCHQVGFVSAKMGDKFNKNKPYFEKSCWLGYSMGCSHLVYYQFKSSANKESYNKIEKKLFYQSIEGCIAGRMIGARVIDEDLDVEHILYELIKNYKIDLLQVCQMEKNNIKYVLDLNNEDYSMNFISLIKDKHENPLNTFERMKLRFKYKRILDRLCKLGEDKSCRKLDKFNKSGYFPYPKSK